MSAFATLPTTPPPSFHTLDTSHVFRLDGTLRIPLPGRESSRHMASICAPIAAGTIAIIDRGGFQKRMAERKSFLLVAMAVGAGGIAVGAYVMWEMLVRVTGP